MMVAPTRWDPKKGEKPSQLRLGGFGREPPGHVGGWWRLVDGRLAERGGGVGSEDLLYSADLPTPPPSYANRRRPRGGPTDQRLDASHVVSVTEISQSSLPRIADPTN